MISPARPMTKIAPNPTAVAAKRLPNFVALMGELVESGDASGRTIADVFLRTIQELRLKGSDRSPGAYGPRALVFSLLGNGATRVCPPQKEVR